MREPFILYLFVALGCTSARLALPYAARHGLKAWRRTSSPNRQLWRHPLIFIVLTIFQEAFLLGGFFHYLQMSVNEETVTLTPRLLFLTLHALCFGAPLWWFAKNPEPWWWSVSQLLMVVVLATLVLIEDQADAAILIFLTALWYGTEAWWIRFKVGNYNSIYSVALFDRNDSQDDESSDTLNMGSMP